MLSMFEPLSPFLQLFSMVLDYPLYRVSPMSHKYRRSFQSHPVFSEEYERERATKDYCN